MKRLLLPLLAAIALPTAVNAEDMSVLERMKNLCEMNYESIEKPYFKRVYRMRCSQIPDNNKSNLFYTKEAEENFCKTTSYKAIRNPKMKNLWEKECKSDYQKSFKNQNNFLKKIFSSNNPEVHDLCKNDNNNDNGNGYKRCVKYFSTQLPSEEENAKRCLIGLYSCKKVNQDYLSSKLKIKVKDKLALEKQKRKDKLARDRLTREQRRASVRSQFNHKGITYTASRTCSEGKRFYWNVEKGFMKKEKVVEIGCLSDYELQSLKNQARKKSGGGSGYDATLRMDMETKRIQNNIHQNYMNRYDRWTEREFGY